jgi:glycosyltransferase involved in cell wall biosynthesis
VRRLRLSHNVGLAQALQCGLAACSFDVVARMDADDISLPHRFLAQLPVIEDGADLVGAAILEFEGDGRADSGVLRVPPTETDEIARTARWRNPFNHPTVVYRRTAVLSAGAYERKGGLRQLRSEIRLQRRLRSEGFTTLGQAARNVTVRGGYRLVPAAVRRHAYRRTFTVTAPVGTSLNVPVAPAWHRHPSAGRARATAPETLATTRPTQSQVPATLDGTDA